MIWALSIVSVLGFLFLFLLFRSGIKNGRLQLENQQIKKDLDNAKKQLSIAANHPDTPASLAERMRNGTL